MINKVTLIGYLGRDAESRYSSSGEQFVTFSIATGDSYIDPNTKERKGSTEWHNVTCFGKQAEIAAQYLKKGALVYLEGKISSRKYREPNGEEKTAYNIVCNHFRMLGGRPDATESYEGKPIAKFSENDDIPF